MLLYSNRSYWRVICELKGSLVFKRSNLLAGLLVAAATFAISYSKKQGPSPWITYVSPSDNVGWNMMGGTVVFAVVFRTNLGWQRYWEALGQIQLMYSKWNDAFTQSVSFVNVTILRLQHEHKEISKEAQARIKFLQEKLGSLQRNFSLLSALSAHRLTHGDVHRMEKRAEIGSWKDQVILRRDLRIGTDLTGATALPGFVQVTDREQLNQNLDNSWFGDYCLTGVPSEDEEKLLADMADRVHAVMYWVLHDLAEISDRLTIAAPIQSRVFQELSNGMLGLQNAIKVADVPFPFQFAQLFNFLMIAFSFFIPIYASVFTESLVLSPIIAYVVHQSILVINNVATQLESPFGTGANDISVKDFHARFLETIIEINPISKYKCTESAKQMAAEAQALTFDESTARLEPLREQDRKTSSVLDSLGSRPIQPQISSKMSSESSLSSPGTGKGVGLGGITGIRRPSLPNLQPFSALSGLFTATASPSASPRSSLRQSEEKALELDSQLRALQRQVDEASRKADGLAEDSLEISAHRRESRDTSDSDSPEGSDDEENSRVSLHGMPLLPNQADDVRHVPPPPIAKNQERCTSPQDMQGCLSISTLHTLHADRLPV